VLKLLQTSLDLFEALPGQAPFVVKESVPDAEKSFRANDLETPVKTSEDENNKRGGSSDATYTAAGTKVPKWLKIGK
jgi:hypothetical protein